MRAARSLTKRLGDLTVRHDEMRLPTPLPSQLVLPTVFRTLPSLHQAPIQVGWNRSGLIYVHLLNLLLGSRVFQDWVLQQGLLSRIVYPMFFSHLCFCPTDAGAHESGQKWGQH